MPLDDTAPQPGADTTAAPTPQPIEITDQRTAADFLERSGLLDALGGDGDDDSGQQPDTGTGETPSTGDEEGHTETPAAKPASIEPPKSWSDEERASFSKLPPDLQQVIASREGERDRAFIRKTEEVADQRKAVEAHTQAIQNERAQAVEAVKTLAATLLPDLIELNKITPEQWARLGADQPGEYARLKSAKDSLEMRLGAAQQLMQGLTQRNAFEQQQGLSQRLAEEAKALAEHIPDFADTAKAAKLTGEIRGDLMQRGFSEQEIGGVTDHRLVEVAVDAMRWRQHQAALKAAKAKTAAPIAPTVQRAGTAPDATGDGANRQVRDIIGRFSKSGDVRDAGKLLEHILG